MGKRFCYVIFTLCFGLLTAALFHCQIINGDYFSRRARNNYLRVVPLIALRGDILDRHARKIAYDRPIFNVAVIPHQIRHKKDEFFESLAQFSGYSKKTIQRNFTTLMSNYFSPVNIITDLNKSDAIALSTAFPDELFIQPQPQRFYSLPYEFSHILGYVKEANAFYDRLKKYGYKPMERVGISGIEEYYDAYLKGEDGGDLIEVNAKGNSVGFIGRRKPLKGKDITLTVDSDVQSVAYSKLGKWRGSIILMESESGAIIAMASSPAYNPNDFILGSHTAKFLLNKNAPMLNRAVKSVYPLGSVFKPMIAVEALSGNVISSGTQFKCTGAFKLGRATFKCMHTHGMQNLYEALAHSCNVYFITLGMRLGEEKLKNCAKRFGFGGLTGVDYPNEAKGLVPSREWKRKRLRQSWYGGDTANFSIGQGYFSVTPIQALVAINAIFNNGYLVRPYFISKIGGDSAENTLRKYIGVTNKVLNEVKKGMWRVVNDNTGTARLLGKLDLNFSGKTGTAQTSGRAHGWFVGVFRYNSKKYAVCVFLENAGSSYEAVKVCYDFLNTLKTRSLL